MSKLPLEIFFQTLYQTDSKEEAFKALKTSFVKRKMSLMDVVKYNVNGDFEELWKMIEIERALKGILEKKEK